MKISFFKPFKLNPDYLISDKGSVYRVSTKRLLQSSSDAYGYKSLTIKVGQGRSTKKIHRLVAELFCEDWNAALTVNHINGIKTDNRAVNLEMMTFSENSKHAHTTGLVSQNGEDNAMCKLSDTQILEIKAFRSKGLLLKEIADIYTISFQHVSDICRNKYRRSPEWEST